MQAVEGVLEELLTEPRVSLLVFNKIDRLDDDAVVQGLRVEFPDSFAISARRGDGLAELREQIWRQAAERAATARAAAARAGARERGHA
jgi:50S ribosomal subunit-associated GTPase HflX